MLLFTGLAAFERPDRKKAALKRTAVFLLTAYARRVL